MCVFFIFIFYYYFFTLLISFPSRHRKTVAAAVTPVRDIITLRQRGCSRARAVTFAAVTIVRARRRRGTWHRQHTYDVRKR